MSSDERKLDGTLSAAYSAWRAHSEFAPDAGASVNLMFIGDLASIEALGFQTGSVVADQALGIVRFKDIPKLVEHPGVLWISGGRRPKKYLDVATKDARARATAPISGAPVDGVWHADDSSGALTHIPRATGKGVIVAIMDTGIDYEHPMFIVQGSSPKKSRILKIWDQGLTPSSVSECPESKFMASSPTDRYGVEFKRAKIEAALNGGAALAHRDCDGHGTHVAGIAAGGTNFSPFVGNAKKVGVAPEADIIAVKYLYPPENIFYRRPDGSVGDKVLDDALFRDAVIYCLRTARELGQPIVINMSFGDNAEPGDGLDPDSRWLDGVMDPSQPESLLNFPRGAIVVKAAGNDGEPGWLPQVYRITVPASGEIIVPFRLSDARDEQQTDRKNCEEQLHKPDVGVHLWYRRPAAPLSVRFAVRLPHGGIFGSDVTIGGKHELGFRPITGPPPNDIAVPFGPTVHRFTIDATETPPAPHFSGSGATVWRQYVHFFVSPKESAGTISYHPGIYEMRIQGPAGTVIYAMTDLETWAGGGKAVMFTVSGTMQNGTSAPADVTAIRESSAVDTGGRHVITVASYDDANGVTTDINFHTITGSSSRGPLRDYSDPASPLPVISKPDIAAPGENIDSAKSIDSKGGLFEWLFWHLGDQFEELSGTSMAAPMVAGAIALMLEKRDNLNTNEVRANLAVTQRVPGESPPFHLDVSTPAPPSPGPAPPQACGAGMLDVLASHKKTI
jgi:subtilisin family serine protease